MERMQMTVGIIWLLLFSLDAGALGDPVLGREKAARCIECHAADGNNKDPKIPKLTGQLPDYLFKQMLEFVSGQRKDHVMSNMIKSVRKHRRSYGHCCLLFQPSDYDGYWLPITNG